LQAGNNNSIACNIGFVVVVRINAAARPGKSSSWQARTNHFDPA
jgi:hypothetical protein